MAELGAPPARRGEQRHPKLRRVGRLCVWSLVIAAVVIVVVNLTVARLPTMPSARRQVHQPARQGDSLRRTARTGCAGRAAAWQPGSYEDFEKVTPELPGLHLISIDRPGYGWSPRGGWLPYQDQIDLVHE